MSGRSESTPRTNGAPSKRPGPAVTTGRSPGAGGRRVNLRVSAEHYAALERLGEPAAVLHGLMVAGLDLR